MGTWDSTEASRRLANDDDDDDGSLDSMSLEDCFYCR